MANIACPVESGEDSYMSQRRMLDVDLLEVSFIWLRAFSCIHSFLKAIDSKWILNFTIFKFCRGGFSSFSYFFFFVLNYFGTHYYSVIMKRLFVRHGIDGETSERDVVHLEFS